MSISTKQINKGGHLMNAHTRLFSGVAMMLAMMVPVTAMAQNTNIWAGGGNQYVQPPTVPTYQQPVGNPQVWGGAAGAGYDPYAPADLNAQLSGQGYQMPAGQPQVAAPVQQFSPYGQVAPQVASPYGQAYPYGQPGQMAPATGYNGAPMPYGYGAQQQIPYGINGIVPGPYGYGAGLPYGAGGGIPYGYGGNNASPWGNNGYGNQFVPYNNIPTGGTPWFSGNNFGFW